MNTLRLLIAFVFLTATGFAQSPAAEEKATAPQSVERDADLAPLSAIHAHVCGIHFYSGDMKRQLIAHHYCAHLSDEVLQCVLYDSEKKNARLIGVEYIVSAKIFESLPAEEKKLWHSHSYEVKSGVLTAPGASETAEKDLMKVLIGTYGKTWHMWQVDRGDKLPLGIPQLMMAFTKDGQLDPKIAAERDKLYPISVAAKKAARADIPDAKIDAGADAWQKGSAVQLDVKAVSMK
ncbi:MAG: OBAP family protein [Chthoniobacterales bacterium]